MDTAITMLRESLPGIKSILKILNTKLQTLKSAPTTSELAAMVEDLGKENKEKAEKLKGFKNGSVKMVTREEMDKVDKDFKYWSQKRKARKNAFDALEGALMEGMSREDIWEQLGLEEDVY
jgi:26S proteasome regulatory subunit (ATPase 3-interacting protein)